MAYRNITISGLPGGGSTTLMRLLQKELGWTSYSGGEFMRSYAIEKGYFEASTNVHHDATVYPDDFDRQVDYAVREKLKTETNYILEAWLTGFFAQGISNVFKVLVICSEDAVRIDRIVNRDHVNVDEAKNHIMARESKNREKWNHMYAKEWQEWVVEPGTMPKEAQIDFWHPKLYDLVIDTYSHSREETLNTVLNAFKKA